MTASITDRARAYLAKMPAAVSGSGGHAATFAVALTLMRGFALDEAAAFPLLAEWNEGQCVPPWSASELRHKLRSAAHSTKPLGYLLGDGMNDPAPAPIPRQSEAERKAKPRSQWPAFVPLKPAGLQSIASIRRNLPLAAVDWCARAGMLSGAHYEGHRCFIIHEAHFAQARRLDGGPLVNKEGREIKAKNLPGSEGAFIGRQWLGETPPILLVEGAIGFMEAIATVIVAGRYDWTVLAATSASSRFSRDPELLALLRGRRVRIVPDADNEGLDAAATWLAELEAVGATVDAVALPDGTKDLGDLLADPERHGKFLREVFE